MTDNQTQGQELITVDEDTQVIYNRPPPVDGELLDLAWRVGKGMALATVAVGKICRGNEGNSFAVALQALRWKMDPFAVSHECYDVKGNLAYSGKLINAVVHANAPIKNRLAYNYSGEGQDRQLTVSATFEGDDEPRTYTTPKLRDIKIQNSPLWKNDPDQQLGYYAARNWARRHASDIMLGVLSVDEAETIPARDVTPKKINALRIDMSDLQLSDEPENKPEAVEVEEIEDAVTVDECTPTQGGEPEVEQSPQETQELSHEPSVGPDGTLWDVMDMFVESPNVKAMSRVWSDYLRKVDMVPALMAAWSTLQTHAAFCAMDEKSRVWYQQQTQKRLKLLEDEVEV